MLKDTLFYFRLTEEKPLVVKILNSTIEKLLRFKYAEKHVF